MGIHRDLSFFLFFFLMRFFSSWSIEWGYYGNLFHSYGSLMAHLVWFSIAMVSFQRLTRWSMMHMPCLKGWLWDTSVGTTNHSICHKTRRNHWKKTCWAFSNKQPSDKFSDDNPDDYYIFIFQFIMSGWR